MKIEKQARFFLLIIGIIVFAGAISFPAHSGEEPKWNHVTFTTHSSTLKFFDHTTGKIYVYDESDGRLRGEWVLEELGINLTKTKIPKKGRRR